MSVLRPVIVCFSLLTIITGLAYPFAVTGVGQLAFPEQTSGSLIRQGNQIKGSELIGQQFAQPRYFWGRPSATAPFGYNGTASGGSNLGPTNPALKAAVEERIKALHDADPENTAPVPVDLVTASGSGLDPHISPAAAEYQLQRVAKARGLQTKQIRQLITQNTEAPQFGIFGEERVNVLKLNLALDSLKP